MASDSITGILTTTASLPPQTTTSSSPSSSTIKGKSKIEEEEEEQTCGICLSEGGKHRISRGWIDSCDHYFCFVCIMEWSKLESKCPLCKRRFSTIRRPPKPGVFLSDRVLNVPVRDQVYHYYGNASVGPPNLYSDLKCAVCQSGADECLLLLCDLCDSASHTYCVGLGATIPEVDWFCTDCTLLRAEQAMNETHAEAEDQRDVGNLDKFSSAGKHVSIFSIVQDPSSVPRFSREFGTRDNTNEVGSRRQPSALPQIQASKLNTRTLWRCHNVHDRIQALRKNWNNFRSGSLSFASTEVDSAVDGEHVIGGTSGQPDSASCLSQPLISQSGPSGMSHNGGSHDISKAWKMMDIAKSIEGRKKTKLSHPSSHPLKRRSASKEADGMSSSLLPSENHRLGYQELACNGPQRHQQYVSLVKDNRRCKARMLGKQHQSIVGLKDVPNFEQGLPVTCSTIDTEYTHTQEASRSLLHNASNGVGRIPVNKNLNGAQCAIHNKVGGSACLDSSTPPAPVKPNSSCSKPQAHTSSSSRETNPFEERLMMRKNCVDGKPKGDNDAKSEIQSIVKLNLKILTKDKRLEIDAFRRIARLATHSILAACGLEHPKPGVLPFPRSVCCHADEIQEVRRSSLMPDSCRECFYIFVKDVVNATVFEKRGCTTRS